MSLSVLKMSTLDQGVSRASLSHLQFKAGANFATWKTKVIGHMDSINLELYESLQHPMAESEAEVAALLGVRPSAGNDAYGAALDVVAGVAAMKMASDGSASSGASVKKERTAEELKALAQCVKMSKKAYGILISIFTEEQIMLVNKVQHGNAHAVWKLITERYERTTMASQHQTRMKLHSTKMSHGELFDAYLARLNETAMRLATIVGKQVDESELLFILLQGLPPSYELLVHSLQMKTDLTVEEASATIRDWQEQKSATIAVTSNRRQDEVHAHFAGNGNRGGKYVKDSHGNGKYGSGSGHSSSSGHGAKNINHSNFKRQCFLCGKTDHVMFACSKLPAGTKKCGGCQNVGHTEAECRYGGDRRGDRRERGANARFRVPEESAAAAAADVSDGSEGEYESYYSVISPDTDTELEQGEVREEESAMSVMPVPVPSAPVERKRVPKKMMLMHDFAPLSSQWRRGPPAWTLDSGATGSMTNDLRLLTETYDIVSPVTVKVATGKKISVKEAGATSLPCRNGGAGPRRCAVLVGADGESVGDRRYRRCGCVGRIREDACGDRA